jgi:hypothetical protein
MIEGMVANRRIASRMGHTIQWNDGPEALGISIMTTPAEEPPTSVVLDGDEVKVTINSLGEVEISGALAVKVSSETAVQIQSLGELTLSGAMVSISAEGTMSVQGATVSISGPEGAPAGEITVSGGMVSLGLG